MNPGNERAQVRAGEVVPLPHGNNPVEQVFGTSVIWMIIGSYLNVGDLKACRLVDSGFHGMVMKATNFLQRSMVSLKPHQITRDHFGSTSKPWRNVLLKFGNPAAAEGSSGDAHFDHEELEWLYPLMSNVEALSLRMEEGTKEYGFQSVLKRLLNASKKLRSLAMEPIFLVADTTEKDLWEEAMDNLEELQILQPPSGGQLLGQLIGLELAWENLVPTLSWYENPTVFKKMSKIRVLKIHRHTLGPSEYKLRNNDETYDGPINFLECSMPYFLTSIAMDNSRNAVKQLTLSRSGCCTVGAIELDDLNAFVEADSFPSLESATFYDFTRDQDDIVGKYLLVLPKLKELEFFVNASLPTTVLNAIEQRSDCLRKLKIESKGFEGANWQFLQRTKINEFQLELLMDVEDEVEKLPDEALNCLPLTIRRLFLQGPLKSNPIPALAGLNPALVTHLTFINSGDCFADDTMSYIVANFKMLHKLNVTNAKRLTDAGFVGSQSASLSGIKGLRTLILRECGSITDLTLREIRFLELHYLDLSHNKELTKDGYEGLLCTNPSLETLLMSCQDIYDRKNEMYASHPRLSSVVKVDMM